MLKKVDRLSSRDIDRLSQGKSVFGTLISMRFTPAERVKIAVSASKKVAPNAVDRNRLRRRVYAAVRSITKTLKKPVFIMLMPKKECLTTPILDIETDIRAIFHKANIS